MTKPETDAPPNLLKPYPASLTGLLCAKCRGGGMDALCGACARAEVRRLRGEVRGYRRLIRGFFNDMAKHRDVDVEAWRVAFKTALAPRRTK